MKILLINHSFPPALTPRAFRWGSVVRSWAAEGHQIDVICGPQGGDAPLPPGVSVQRVGTSRRLAVGMTAPPPSSQGRPPLHGLAADTARKLWRRVFWPDGTMFWIPAARRKAQSLARETRYDLMISSSHPFSGHLVGLAVKKRHPDLNWLVDIGDPFSFADGAPANNFALYGALNRRAEGEVLARADSIAVTTEGTRERYAALFPATVGKIAVIPPLLTDTFQTAQVGTVPDKRIRLVFVGTLYGDIRSPAPLLKLFAKLARSDLGDRLELHFYGSSVNCDALFDAYGPLLGSSIFRHGLVPQSEAARAMREANVLVNIGNSTEYQLPSKVVEYAAMAKPILNFIAADTDSSMRFFANFDGVRSISASSVDDPATASALERFLLALPEIDIAARGEQIVAHTPPRIAADYLRLARSPKPSEQE